MKAHCKRCADYRGCSDKYTGHAEQRSARGSAGDRRRGAAGGQRVTPRNFEKPKGAETPMLKVPFGGIPPKGTAVEGGWCALKCGRGRRRERKRRRFFGIKTGCAGGREEMAKRR